jgi:hypothetical protein
MRFMATPGQLVAATARAFELPEGSVAHPWRVLREAGEVTVGARGVNAAHVTLEDAAKLFIAVAAESPLKSTLESWREFAQLPPFREPGLGGPERGPPPFWCEMPTNTPFKNLRSLPRYHRFLDALSALMLDLAHESARDRVFLPRFARSMLDVRLSAPHPMAKIRLRRVGGPNDTGSYANPLIGSGPRRDNPLLITREISAKPMCDIARFVADTRPEDVGRDPARAQEKGDA